MESAPRAIARAVRARRIELELTVDEAAARARIPAKAWRVIEQGTSHPSWLMIGTVCQVLEWTPATIESVIRGELQVDGGGLVVVDAPPPPAPPQRVASFANALDIDGLSPEQLAEVQDFIDDLRDGRG